jgi:hypothetical protein
MKSVPYLALCLLGAAIAAHALFEDQAGQYSWHKEFVGDVRHALFAFKGRDRCFVGTGADVLASLDLRKGGLIWRQALAAGDSLAAITLVPKPACVVSLSAQGLRAWRAGDGTLLWDAAMEGAGGSSVLRVLPDVTGDGSSDIAVLAGGKLRVRCLLWAGACMVAALVWPRPQISACRRWCPEPPAPWCGACSCRRSGRACRLRLLQQRRTAPS